MKKLIPLLLIACMLFLTSCIDSDEYKEPKRRTDNVGVLVQYEDQVVDVAKIEKYPNQLVNFTTVIEYESIEEFYNNPGDNNTCILYVTADDIMVQRKDGKDTLVFIPVKVNKVFFQSSYFNIQAGDALELVAGQYCIIKRANDSLALLHTYAPCFFRKGYSYIVYVRNVEGSDLLTCNYIFEISNIDEFKELRATLGLYNDPTYYEVRKEVLKKYASVK